MHSYALPKRRKNALKKSSQVAHRKQLLAFVIIHFFHDYEFKGLGLRKASRVVSKYMMTLKM